MAKSAWYWRQAGKEHKAKSWIGEQAKIQLKIGLGNKLQKSKKLDWGLRMEQKKDWTREQVGIVQKVALEDWLKQCKRQDWKSG